MFMPDGVVQENPTREDAIRVVIVDDSRVVLRAVSRLISGTDGMTVVGEGSNGEEAVALVLQQRPHVAVLDARMPVQDGVEATRQIKAQAPGVKVLMFSTFSEYFDSALEAGADAFLLKDSAAEVLLNTIRRLATSEREGR